MSAKNLLSARNDGRHSPSLAVLTSLLAVTGFVRVSLGAAEREARNSPGADTVAWVDIDRGRSASSSAEAEKLFRDAEAHAKNFMDPWAQAAAVNCRALLWARTGRTREAIDLLGTLPFSGNDPEAFVFKYNLGRLEEDGGQRDKALKAYETSLTLRPDYDTARDRLYGLLLKGDPDIPRAIWTGDLMINQGQAALVAPHVLDLLDRWGSDPKASALLVQLARVYTACNWNAKRFKTGGERRVRDLREKYSNLTPISDQLIDAFEAEKPGAFPAWESVEGGTPAMSRLLVTLADGQLGENPPRLPAALARFEAAWRLDRANTQAAVAYASALGRYSKQVDPDGKRLRSFVGAIIDQKGNLYALPTRSRTDWLNLLRLHTILASILDENPSFASQGGIYSSVYQWRRATEVQQDIQKRVDPSFPLSPHLYLGLANAQSKELGLNAAWISYVRAAASCGPTDRELGLNALKSARDIAAKVSIDPPLRPEYDAASTHVQGLVGAERERLSPGFRYLPPEYRAANLPQDVSRKLGEANEKFELQMTQTPLKSDEIAQQRTQELDTMLTPAQRDAVNKVRVNRSAPN